jgi:hypothetical protein
VAALTAGVVGCATAVTADPATEPTAWTTPLGLGVAAAGVGAAVLALGAGVVPWVSVEPTA